MRLILRRQTDPGGLLTKLIKFPMEANCLHMIKGLIRVISPMQRTLCSCLLRLQSSFSAQIIETKLNALLSRVLWELEQVVPRSRNPETISEISLVASNRALTLDQTWTQSTSVLLRMTRPMNCFHTSFGISLIQDGVSTLSFTPSHGSEVGLPSCSHQYAPLRLCSSLMPLPSGRDCHLIATNWHSTSSKIEIAQWRLSWLSWSMCRGCSPGPTGPMTKVLLTCRLP